MPAISDSIAREIFPRLSDDVGVDEVRKRLVSAASQDYATMLDGTAPDSTLLDWKAHRLTLIILHVLQDRIPAEDQVARIFRVPETTAGQILKKAMSVNGPALSRYLVETVRYVIDRAEPIGSENPAAYFRIHVRSKYLTDFMNRIIEDDDPDVERIRRKRNVNAHQISADALAILRSYCDIEHQ
jgi:hypothetical protein